MTTAINRTSPVPYYEQLYEILLDQITSGAYPADSRLPSEMELSRDFALSRATVRQTLQKLEAAGMARRVARRGFFAAAPSDSAGWTVQNMDGFLEAQLRHGRRGVETEVIGYGPESPPSHVRTILRLSEKEPVFALERVRSLDGVPVLVSTNWLPGPVGDAVASASDVLQGTGSLDRALRDAGYVTAGAHRLLEALPAPEAIAGHLTIKANDPLLRIRSWSWTASDVRFDYYETWLRTDIMPVEVAVTATGPEGQ